MKKKKYEFPEIEVLEVELQGMVMTSDDENGTHTGPGLDSRKGGFDDED